MHKELHTIGILKNYLIEKGLLEENTTGIDQIYQFFSYIANPNTGCKFNSLYILNYFQEYIVSAEVAKRKTSARVVEDLLAILFNGSVTDADSRRNLTTEVPSYFQNVRDKIAGNKREKIDLLFNNKNYGISVKTLMESNPEINMGSFEKNVLFDGLNVHNDLQERKTSSEIGLGSVPRLTNLLNKIKTEGNYQHFESKFNEMFKYIFSDDIILAIKKTNAIDIYFIKGDEFVEEVCKRTANISELMSVVNRWEGNSIRLKRDYFITNSMRKVSIDLSILDKTVIKHINCFDRELHKTYIEYFNVANNHSTKVALMQSLDNLFIEFDTNFNHLI